MSTITTLRRYSFDEVTSAMQKAVRRGDAKVAGYFALELFHSGFWKYVWKRFYTISAEDCHGILTTEIDALFNGFLLVNDAIDNKVEKIEKGRIFISKAVLLLCAAPKSRDADHLQCIYYDKNLEQGLIEEYLREKVMPIPEYTFDCHTLKGKRMGKTKAAFFKDEFEALQNRQTGFFDDLIQ